jgi:hypothetical protein
MPYYQEWIENQSTAGYFKRSAGATRQESTGRANVNLVILDTYRSRPGSPKGNLVERVEIPDAKADPFNVFANRNRIKRDAAISRGFSMDLFKEDRGHPFQSIRYESEGSLWSGSLVTPTSYYTDEQRGANLDVIGDDTDKFGFQDPNWSDLPAYAQTAYAKAAPDPAIFKLSNFLGELPMGLPKFGTAFAHANLLKKTSFFRAVGDDYLNLSFGWIPFVSDLVSIGQSLAGATTALLGPRGPLHRYRGEDPNSSGSSSTIAMGRVIPTSTVMNSRSPIYTSFMRKLDGTQPTGAIGNGNQFLWGKISYSSMTTTERWFEGEYTFIPKVGFNPDSYFDRLEALMDPTITPSVLWELAPWSWLTDWFLKIGNTIAANEVASDSRIISNYAYAMEKVEIKRGAIFSSIGTGSVGYAGPTAIARQWTTTGKRRIRANPFGFKPMTAAGLNPNQWTILAALGLAKAGR